MTKILCPRCPLCRRPPKMALRGMGMVFCGNDDCSVLSWDATRSLDDNLLDANPICLDGLDPLFEKD